MNSNEKTSISITVAIPTYRREEVLLSTLNQLIRLKSSPLEIMVLDQTEDHKANTIARLKSMAESGKIVWIPLRKPSITRAMNEALLHAKGEVVLFLDDDVIPSPGLLEAHIRNYEDEHVWAVAGQVLQPGESPYNGNIQCRTTGLRAYLDFPFNSSSRAWVNSVMAGNLSLRKERALEVGGFDENFVGVAYRFETEFARRIIRHGGKILYQPKASIHHLQVQRGGTRTKGSHLNSISPLHGVGDYYFVLRQGLNIESLVYMCWRPFREIRTKFHLKHPWWIPIKFIGEIRAMIQAFYLYHQGPKLLDKRKLTDM